MKPYAGPVSHPPCQDGDRPLHMASEAGFADVVEALLEAGADPDAPGQVSGRRVVGAGRGRAEPRLGPAGERL